MPTIRQQLLIGAPAEKVYAAITSREGLQAWWTPDSKAGAELHSHARFEFADGAFNEMEITELDPPRSVRWHCIDGIDEWVGTTLSFDLDAQKAGTVLRSHPEMKDQIEQQADSEDLTVLKFRHDDWKADTPMLAECSYTWGRFLRSLKLYCETGTGLPWPYQHRAERQLETT